MKSPFEGRPPIRRYSIIPARAMQDDRLIRADIRVLACLGMYTNSYGVCWPSQQTIGRHLNHHHVWICRTMGRLMKYGYVRKLEPRPYPKHIKRRGKGIVNRYQVLWEGNDPLPTDEQFWAPAARFSEPEEMPLMDEVIHRKTGVTGDSNSSYQILAHEFRRSVEAATGLVRAPEQSMPAAKSLADQGVTVDQVRDATTALCREWMAKGRTPPANLSQVESLMQLCKK